MRHHFIFICICFGITLLGQNEVINVDYPASTSFQTAQQGGKLSQTVVANINDSVVVSSVSELAQAAKGSGRHVTMTPGVYQMEDYLTSEIIAATQADAIGRKAMRILVATSNVTLYNTSGMPVELAGNTSNCKITSNGEVTNSGSGNKVVIIE